MGGGRHGHSGGMRMGGRGFRFGVDIARLAVLWVGRLGHVSGHPLGRSVVPRCGWRLGEVGVTAYEGGATRSVDQCWMALP